MPKRELPTIRLGNAFIKRPPVKQKPHLPRASVAQFVEPVKKAVGRIREKLEAAGDKMPSKDALARLVEAEPEFSGRLRAHTIYKILTRIEREGIKIPRRPDKSGVTYSASFRERVLAYYHRATKRKGAMKETSRRFGVSQPTIRKWLEVEEFGQKF